MSAIESASRHRIETAGQADCELMAEIHAASFDEIWDAAAIREILAMPGAFGLLGHARDGPAGLAIARVAADEAELLALGVHPRHRRRGLGDALLRAACATALAAGATKMFLEVAVDNEFAVLLYRSLGFSECGFRRGYYAKRSDAIDARTALVMYRQLASGDGDDEADGGIAATTR